MNKLNADTEITVANMNDIGRLITMQIEAAINKPLSKIKLPDDPELAAGVERQVEHDVNKALADAVDTLAQEYFAENKKSPRVNVGTIGHIDIAKRAQILGRSQMYPRCPVCNFSECDCEQEPPKLQLNRAQRRALRHKKK